MSNPNSREQACTPTLGTPLCSYWVGREGAKDKLSWQHIKHFRGTITLTYELKTDNNNANIITKDGITLSTDEVFNELNAILSKSNTWERVWRNLKKHPLIDEVAQEHAKSGNHSCASILLDAFDQAYESHKELNE